MSSSLHVNWAFGFSKDVTNSVHNLTTEARNAIFYLSSHSGVIYDFEHRTQVVLQGHCNQISCCAVSPDKRWIVTADIGEDPIFVVWDSFSGAPVKTIFNPHRNGVKALDISNDAMYIITLSEREEGVPQEVAVWAWTTDSEVALVRKACPVEDTQTIIKFDPSSSQDIVTTGNKTVCFWNRSATDLDVYVGKISQHDMGTSTAPFSSTIFLPGTGTALTTTKDGAAVFWETNTGSALKNVPKGSSLKTVSKVISLVESGINFATTTPAGYVVIACADGTVKFYDFSLRIEAWFEDLAAGPVNSISFALQNCPYAPSEGGAPGSKFWVPDFMVGTTDAFIVGVESIIFDEVRPEDRRGTLLMQGMTDYVSDVACHPSRSLAAFSSYNGSLQIWDYNMKLLMNLREFNTFDKANDVRDSAEARLEALNFLKPQCIAFEPKGEFLVVGFTSGHVKFLDVNTLEDIASFAPTFDTVKNLKFSPSGIYLTCSDDSNHVLLFKKSSEVDPSTLGDEAGKDQKIYIYLGRTHSHESKITGLEFGYREGMETLVSVGEDRKCVEYDLEMCTVINGICTIQDDRSLSLDLTARPSALIWSSVGTSNLEDKFMVANDEFKLKEYNLDSKQCRRTTLSPTYGGPVVTMLPLLDAAGQVNHYAYATGHKVIGVGTLPSSGNPAEVTGLVAHPGYISSIATSFDGTFVFSCGGNDLSVNMWAVDTASLTPATSKTRSEEMGSFYSLLDGGEGGELYDDIANYFYYSQLRSQGEDAMEERRITGKIPVTEIPSVMRAVGFYPSEEQVTNMMNEVKYKDFLTTGELGDSINLDELIKLYINHRPVIPLSNHQVISAFETIIESAGNGFDSVRWEDLKRLVISEGEPVISADLDAYLKVLTGQDAEVLENIQFDAIRFAEGVLGFEDFMPEEFDQ